MSIIFKPNGPQSRLNISTDPSDLPEQRDQYNISSGALTRCKNLRTDQPGKLLLRNGSVKIHPTALASGQAAPGILGIFELSGNRYVFAGSSLYYNENATAIATSLAQALSFGIRYNSFNSTVENVFTLNGTDRKRLEAGVAYEWGVDAPGTAPTIAVGALTGLAGDYNAKYTYVRKENSTVVFESNPSDAAGAAQTLSNESLSVTVTTPSDSQITHIRVYRTGAGGSTYLFDTEQAISDLTFDLNTADGSLGTEVLTTHNRPPAGSFCIGPNYNGISFIINTNLLYFSLSKQPEYWPATQFLEIESPDDPGKCGVFYNGQLYYLSGNTIYYIQGTGTSSFFPIRTDAITGARSANGAVAVQGQGIYHTGHDGIYLWNAGGDRKITQDNFEPLFRDETVKGLPGGRIFDNSWLHYFGNKLYFGYPAAGQTYANNVLVFDLLTNKTAHYDYSDAFRVLSTDEFHKRLLAGDNSGFVWHVEKSDRKTDADDAAISWDVESKAFTLSTRAHFPRYAKYDINASKSDNATGEILLDDVSHKIHALTKDRNTERRLINTGNGQSMSLRAYGSGPVEIHMIEAE